MAGNPNIQYLCCTIVDKVSCVLVPGAAGPAGINAIKSLKIAGYTGSIVATDSSSLSAGFYLASKYAVLPEVDNKEMYAEQLLGLVSRDKVQVLMPSSGYDIYAYSELRKQLEERGAVPVVSSRQSLEICRDKLLTYKRLVQKYPNVIPFTTSDPDKVSSFPVIAKPRFGKGSRNVVKIDNDDDLRYVTSKYRDMIFQEFLPGDEFSVDVMCDLGKKPILAVPRLRLQTKGGISTKGKILRNAQIESLCMDIARSIEIVGPACIQIKRSLEGLPKLVEVNPRMGGGTIFTTLAGANFPKMILDMVEGNEISIPKISEITVVRYFDEIVLDGISKDSYNLSHIQKMQSDSIA